MNIEVKQKLKLNMTLNLQQSIKLLEMNMIDLNNYILKTALENPLIEIENKNTELDIEKYIRRNNGKSKNVDFFDDKLKINEKSVSLLAHIKNQLSMMNLSEEESIDILVLVDSLDRNGYLEFELLEIASNYGRSIRDLEIALNRLQNLDPKGLGGKNFVEALKLQVEDDDLLNHLIDNHLEDIYKKNYNKITRILDIDEKLLAIKIKKLKELNPKPALPYNIDNNIDFVIPDARIEVNGKVVEVIINDYILPDVTLSKYYKTYLKNDNKETKKYVKNMKNEYDWLKSSLEIRKNTLYKVIGEITKTQYEYFIKGEKYLVPIKQKDIADKLNISESTVSRIVNDKYIETNNGILSLKYFFYSGPAEMISDIVIQNLIKEIIGKENRKKPLSDNKISEIIEENGIKIARRTVTKYREKLGIESSTRRKEIS